MVDERLSACVVAYVGRPGQLGGPEAALERVRVALGGSGLELVPAVTAVVADLDDAEPAPWRLADMTQVAVAATAFVREHHPELSDDAVRAVVNAYCYSWK